MPFFIVKVTVMDKKKEFKTIHDVGYTTLMNKLNRFEGKIHDDQVTGKGEACSVWEAEKDSNICLLQTSGIWLEGVHFDLVYTPLKHLGYKMVMAVVHNISSMNGEPHHLELDLAVPNKISVEMLQEIFRGADTAAKDCGCSLRPGEVTASRQLLAISAHVTGKADKVSLVMRKGASTGDQICVSGDLGGAFAGLRILLREKKAWQESGTDYFQPDLEKYEYVVGRQLMPSARYDMPKAFEESGVKPTAMIHIKQGLLNELQQMSEAGGSGFEIFTPALPIALETRHVADEMKEDVDRYAFYGGEDFELLFTLRPEEVEKLRSEFEDFTVIGEVKPENEGIRLVTGEGKQIDLSELENQMK